MSPTIVLRDGKPVMTVGAPGSQRIISGVAQVISNVIDFDMDIQDAISAPRIHAGSDWTTSDETIMIETRIPQDVIEGLKKLGDRRLDGLSLRAGGSYAAGRNAARRSGSEARRKGGWILSARHNMK